MSFKREDNLAAGSGISVTPTNNPDGTVSYTVTNTSPSSGGTVTGVGAGTGISITGTSTVPIVNMAASGVGAGTYGDGSHFPTFTVDATGRVTAASQVALPVGPGFAWVTAGGAFEAFGTVLGGDVSQGTHALGLQPLTVGGLKGAALPALPGTDQYLHYTGSAWAFSALPTAVTVSGGAGISVTGGPAYTVTVSAATAHSVMTTGAGTGGFTAIAPGTSGTYLRSNGSSADVSWQSPITSAYSASPGNTVTVSNAIVSVTSTSVTTTASQWLVIWASFFLDYNRTSSADTFTFGVGVNTSASFTESRVTECPSIAGNPIGITPTTMFRVQPGAGTHTIHALAQLGSAGAQAIDADLVVLVVDA